MINPFSVKSVLPFNGACRFRIAKVLAWLFQNIIYPLGGTGYSTAARTLIGSSALTVAIFESGGCFVFPCSDGYYSNKLLNGLNYEQDITFILGNIYSSTAPFFLDCGANFGYWSTAVSSLPTMAHRVVGIEPSLQALPLLRNNQSENKGRFEIRSVAIWDRSGQVGFKANAMHSSAAIAENSPNYMVKSTTVDNVIEQIGWSGKQVVIKLDIEGAEIAAFRGAERAAWSGSIFIYEDHGGDKDCRVTAFLLDRGWTVYFIAADRLVRIHSTKKLSPLKPKWNVGYNLVAWRVETELSASLRSLASARRAR